MPSHSDTENRPTTPRSRSRWITALLVLIMLAGAALAGWSLWSLSNEHRQQQHAEQTLTPRATFKPVPQPSGSTRSATGTAEAAEPTGTPDTTDAANSANASETTGMDPSSRQARPGEDDPGLHTLVGGQVEGTDESSQDSPAWQGLLTGMGDVQDVPEGMAEAWECRDGQADTGMGQVDWDKAERVTGAAVFVPSVCLASPMISTDIVTASDGSRQLELPETPWSTWYKQSAPPAATSGNTYIASHLNSYGHWENGPFKQLEAVPMGAPIIVRDEAGTYTVFTASESLTALQSDAMTDPDLQQKLFRRDGEHTLSLITCVRGTSGHFDTNRILMAVAVQ